MPPARRLSVHCDRRFDIDVTDDVIREHGYLVERGVRPLALIGHCSADEVTRLQTLARVEQLVSEEAIAFVIETRDGVADVGVAAHKWAIDLYAWASSTKTNAVPDEHRHRILGLLLGYGTDAIARYDERASARSYSE